MESALTKACTIKIQNFEGPFDLLFHLFEKNQVNIYDIPINEITDQYMEYLFAMQQMDLEVASEFLVMAATLLHIKSKMLLPEKKEKEQEEVDPRDELVSRLIEYKKYKEFSATLKEREKEWDRVVYKLPELIELKWEEALLELSPEVLQKVYIKMLERNKKKLNTGARNITQIIQHEKVSLRSKMREIIRNLFNRAFVRFSDIFTLKTKSRTEVVTGFLAVLELSKLKKVKLEQKHAFAEILVYRNDEEFGDIEDEKVAGDDYR
ncbi:MAG: segregation/condensation protein A [Clostridia bacterium]|nr:segregation/condensation protein A [Clostridia bacterium]